MALLGYKGGGGPGLAGAALSGQEGNGVRLKRDVTINMLLGGACGKARGGGGHGICHGGRFWAVARRRLQRQTTRGVVITTEDEDGWDLPPLPARLQRMRRWRSPPTETAKSGHLGVKDFNSMKTKKCVVWLGEIGCGMTWDEHLVAAVRDIGDQWLAEGEILGEDFRLDGPPMFALGGV